MFESHLKLYKQYFHLISLDDFYQGKFNDDRFNLCLSFDDGFANNYKHVLPLLEVYQVPAVFFVTAIRDTGHDILWNDVLSIAYKHGPPKIFFRNNEFIKIRQRDYVSTLTGQRLVDFLRSTESGEKAEVMRLLNSVKEKADPDFWLQMTNEEIRALSESKWATVGSHSYFHHDLAKISLPVLKKDLIGSKQFLENITGKEVKALAFPYGSYNDRVIAESKNVGFTQLLATDFLFSNDQQDTTLRERLTINPFISGINQMHANIDGKY
jgi:peptidoglycan/xylan/chitin deacetylase (PgdA/CDA1 family)